MKTSFMTAIATITFTLAASAAVAGNRVCVDTNSGPDHGYQVAFDSTLTAARVSMQSIAGPQALAQLKCQVSRKRAPGADQTYVIAQCFEPQLRDAGYSVVISGGGFTGMVTAQLSEISIAGATPVASLFCRN